MPKGCDEKFTSLKWDPGVIIVSEARSSSLSRGHSAERFLVFTRFGCPVLLKSLQATSRAEVFGRTGNPVSVEV